MEEIRNRMMKIEDPRHPSYVKHGLADILIIIMCGALCGLDTLEDLVVYAKSAGDFLRETFGIVVIMISQQAPRYSPVYRTIEEVVCSQ